MTVNHYIFDTKRGKCPYCGSSDGFARLLTPDTKQPVADNIGKCHSCNVFRTQTEAGFVTESGDLVASKGVAAPKYFDIATMPKYGLIASRSTLVEYAHSLTGADVVERIASEMYVLGDMWGNTTFVYADIENRGTSVKTICYGATGSRSKEGLAVGSRRLDTSQIAGYVSAEGQLRYARVSDGAYQFLYNQHRLPFADLYDAMVLVESEKTAYIASVLSHILGLKLLFLAAGGSNGVSPGKVRSLNAVNAIPEELLQLLRNKPMVICYDADEAGEKGSKVAKDALESLDCKPIVYNMSALLQDSKTSMPIVSQQAADIADAISYAMQNGGMLDEIERLLKALYNKALGIVNIKEAFANNELVKINASDYHKAPPTASMTFTDAATHKTSQLAIPGNIVMLLASPGVGKSSVISAIVARHISPTTNAFGLDVVAPNGIVVIDTEQPRDQVVLLHKRMARRIGCAPEQLPDMFDATNVHWYVSNKSLSVDKQVDNLFAAIQETQPSLVIVDQVGSLVLNVNNNDEVQTLVKRIAYDAESSGRTWVVVLHTNPTSDKGRGVLGSDIHRWAASVLFIKRPANDGDPSLLTTSNVDGIMAKVRSGPAVRCFFSWDDSRGDFYPTTHEQSQDLNFTMVRAALDEVFDSSDGTTKALSLSELRQSLKEVLGAAEATKVANYILKEKLLKRTFNGKLWPDYEKLQDKA